ncbi:hypothetical protein CI109_104329 [Kwoniella shandongensis]|uniref:Uncharacterized protein n=1 Tax=Kwoniella shandongensis TaxID=1734106 RepID=A0A5M6BX41_9TREE|nr:uncharacterized protein CI109_004275 [Kwoniella shandongensis]KAA5527457.1 hypothetical protein CI109_004275 [Kwoniella shandongensis]
MPPIAITFHFPTPTSSSSSSSSQLAKRPISTTNARRKSAKPIFITYDKTALSGAAITTGGKQQNKLKTIPTTTTTTNAPPPASPPDTTTTSSSTSSAEPKSGDSTPSLLLSSGSKRRKGPVHILSASTKTASLTPLLRPIVTRCSATTLAAIEEIVHTPTILSPPRKRLSGSNGVSGKSKSNHPTHVWPTIHPYSRASDLSNTRSSVPSPREVLRSQRIEEEKARLKKESAALARAAVAAKRKKPGPKPRGGSRAPSGKRARSDSPTKVIVSPEEKDKVPTITREPASTESSPAPTFGTRSVGLKRTRSNGVLPISTALAHSITAAGTVGSGSPLKAVMGPSGEEDDLEESNLGPIRKRSRLASTSSTIVDRESVLGTLPTTTRRANTTSPIGTPSTLPDSDNRQQPKTFPLPPGQLQPKQAGGRASSIAPSSTESLESPTTGMRRVLSATGTPGGSRHLQRKNSESSEGSVARSERSRREVTMPNRLKDYEMKPASPLI